MADCQERDPALCELYLVEGDSAGGSAKQARDRKTQAVLPLKGKILNVEKARFDKMLSNDEIKMMISAIGVGIGRENIAIDKIRYHKIIIMTDADVDGSHIRTLLLTFFYRQMPEIIERGYVYIAQPPLYKAKKGSTEVYLKNEQTLTEFLLSTAIKDIKIKNTAQEIEVSQIREMISNIRKLHSLLSIISSRYDSSVLLHILLGGHEAKLNSIEGLEELSASTTEELLSRYIPAGSVAPRVSSSWDVEAQEWVTTIVRFAEKQFTRIGANFVHSPEWQELYSLFAKIKQVGSLPLRVEMGGAEQVFDDYFVFAEDVIEKSKKGFYIQRYKGLGEMNPEQLWETTLNPEHRTLLQVNINDVVSADETFSVLMGELVDPRRRFINDNALSVKELDV